MAERHFLKSDIEVAQANTLSAAQAAKYLHVSYNTYKKWAKYFGIWKTNVERIGIKGSNNRPTFKMREEELLRQVLEGKYPNFNRFKLKSLALKYGFLHEECSLCGYHEQRVTDGKVPLYLHFRDGDKKNFKFENLEILCLNCVFQTLGDLKGPWIEYTYTKDDPLNPKRKKNVKEKLDAETEIQSPS